MFSEPFPIVSMRFAHSNGWLQSRISLQAYSRWFCFLFRTAQSVGRSVTFRVKKYGTKTIIHLNVGESGEYVPSLMNNCQISFSFLSHLPYLINGLPSP